MPIEPRQLLARPFPAHLHAYTQHDSQLFALGLGLGSDPLDAGQLRYVYEGSDGAALRTLPTMANILAYPGFWARESDTGITWQKLLHAEVLRTALAYDDARFAGMRGRFTAPAWPGDTLRTDRWVRGRTVSLRTTAVERDVVVLNNACVTLR